MHSFFSFSGPRASLLLIALMLAAGAAVLAPISWGRPGAGLRSGADPALMALTKNQVIEGFRTEAVYLNDADRPMGARFIHQKTGFILDLLRIESVPQAFTWVQTFPTSDQGEPHTQEHLVLGKGTTGRAFAGLDTMWLATSSAFTEQLQTAYHFNTAAGADVFFDLYKAQMNALLHPNYTDEEIRREVRNFGVAANPDGTLRLEEKGTVYNEMVSTSGNPYSVLFRSADRLAYGKDHPLAYNSGGEPAGLRAMKPEDIRRFHQANYRLANMATIAALPTTIALNEALRRTGAILDAAEPGGSAAGPAHGRAGEDDLPAFRPAAAGTIALEEYPHKNDQQPSPVMISWPAERALAPGERFLADLFIAAIAGDPTTNLYKLFIDSSTRSMDIGAKALFGSVSRHKGNEVQIVLVDVAATNLTDARLAPIRSAVTGEIARIAALPDGSPELRQFNERVANRLTEASRDLAKFLNTPPRFGARGTGSEWMDGLLELERTKEFRRSVTFKPQAAFVRGLLRSSKNFWHEYLAKWKITGVVPYVVAAKPSPALLARQDAEREERVLAETDRLATKYALSDPQETIRRYKSEYDAETARIEEEASKIPQARLVKTPPMTLDDQLQFAASTLDGGVPIVTSRFENMSSATVLLALRLDALPPELRRYVSLLPTLMTEVGVIENGKPVPYEEMRERLRREILGLEASFATNPRTERVELLVRGSGLGAAEASRALDWMGLVLLHPDWRPENLPRIRDVVDQALSALRNTMQGPEESWVQDPASAYRMQTNPIFLAADSAFTQTHNALRLRWLLREAPAGQADALRAFLTRLADAAKEAGRADLKAFLTGAAPVPAPLQPYADALAALPAPARPVAKDALEDLDRTLIEIPDASLAADWSYLCGAVRDDLLTPPSKALADLEALRRLVVNAAGARLSLVGSSTVESSLQPKIKALTSTLDRAPAPARPERSSARLIDARLRARDAAASDPVYVGLLAPNMQGGVILTSVPGVAFADAGDRAKLLDYLASRLYSGYGAHGIFLKTIGGGLAYSNGVRASVSSGRVGYYAERTPEIPQTVKFVIDDLKGEKRDPRLAEYAVAQVFGEFRSAASYEARAEGIAADLADGQKPDQVRRFREAVLELRKEPKLGDLLFERKDAVYGRILPGYNVKGKDVAGGVFFTIGPDRQLDAWERYLKSVEGPETRLFRLYPRDFWMP